MFKKILSLAIVAMLLMSVVAISASAAQVEVAEEAAAADDVASQGAEADVAATGSGMVYFDASSCGWENASSILFYISDIKNGELAAWGSKKKLGGTSNDGGKTWEFDAAGLGVTDGNVYIIIFNNYDTSAETYQLLMDTSCFGDTASADPSKMIENPVDSNKKSMEARWNSGKLGPRLQISSIGSIVGDTIPSNTTAYEMFVNFLSSKGNDGLENALKFNGKDAKTTIDEVAKALGLSQDEVNKAIIEARDTGNPATGDKQDWTKEYPVDESSGGGSTSSSKSGDSSSSGSSSKSSGSTSGSSGSSSTKSGSASNTQTGQEETILFIMLGVMVLAAGVIFFVRKKERA